MKNWTALQFPFTGKKQLGLAVCAALFTLLLLPFRGRAAEKSGAFYLKNGDKVCFYGDSITEQRFYGADVEAYVRTRFPDLRVKFVNSGVGGDKVTGGWAGPIDERLKRDVFPFKPNIVTIMLGMNDGLYRPLTKKIFDTYKNGYEHIIESLQKHLPGVRIVLIQPSPYDDITEKPWGPNGYNSVMIRFSKYVRQLAEKHHLPCVDFNTPLVDVMKKVLATDPKLAHDVIPKRIHPSAAGELVMAQALLKAWNAPTLVTAVSLDAAHASITESENTTVSNLHQAGATISWTQADRCLPFPILALHNKWPQFPPTEIDSWSLSFYWHPKKRDWNKINPATAAIIKASGFYAQLDQQPLKVSGLKPGQYELKIDGQAIGTFDAAQLGSGINLARYHTPMLDQSYHVLDLVWKQIQWRFFAWRGIQTQLTFDHDPAVQKASRQLIAALEAQKQTIVEKQYEAAKPRTHHYELVPLKSHS